MKTEEEKNLLPSGLVNFLELMIPGTTDSYTNLLQGYYRTLHDDINTHCLTQKNRRNIEELHRLLQPSFPGKVQNNESKKQFYLAKFRNAGMAFLHEIYGPDYKQKIKDILGEEETQILNAASLIAAWSCSQYINNQEKKTKGNFKSLLLYILFSIAVLLILGFLKKYF
jgi:hypothetical protein